MSHPGDLARLPCMNVVILGAGYAGVTAALRLAKRTRGRAQITLVNTSDRFVERVRLHQWAAGQRAKVRPIARILRGTGVSLVVGAARAVDPARRTVEVGGALLPWDRLVLALGSRTDDAIPGAREHAYLLDPGGAEGLAAEAEALAARGGRVVVVGGGLTGIETATELAESWPGLRVTLVTRGVVGAGFSEEARRHFARALARLGVDVVEQTSVLRVERDRIATSGGELPFDACVWALGFVAPPLPRGLELARNARGQVLVDPFLRSITDPRVSVAGDLAAPVEPPGLPLPMGCKAAGPSGAHVAENLARALRGEPEEPFDFATPFYCVSLGRKDGVIQYTLRDGSLEGPVLTRRRAAWLKELICRITVLWFPLERLGLASYRMMRSGNVPALPARTAQDDLAA